MKTADEILQEIENLRSENRNGICQFDTGYFQCLDELKQFITAPSEQELRQGACEHEWRNLKPGETNIIDEYEVCEKCEKRR